jgi:hypothetical protein
MTVTVKDFVTAVKAEVESAFENRIQTVEDFNGFDRGKINTPAVLFHVERMIEGQDIGDGRVPLQCEVTAYCCLSLETGNVQTEVREFASELMSLIRRNRFGLGGDAADAENISAQPGPFQLGSKGFDSFEITWSQTIFTGENVWSGGTPVSEVWFGISPEVGQEHIDDYEQLVP